MRRGDWEQALAAYFADCEGRPHVYGSIDCILFAAGAELAMTGEDPAATIRGRYRSMAGAGRLLKQLGFPSLEAAIDAQKDEVPISFAQRGDWVLHDGIVGVSAGRLALFMAETVDGDGAHPALARIPRAEWHKAWRVA